MTCPRCQQDNPPHAKFCLGCGARLTVICGSCGTELPGGARFCLQCGQPLAVGATVAAKSPPPETYTPKHLAEKILTSRSALEGERKQVTVLFADLKGSMELLADRDPEEARTLLDPVLERMMEAVHAFEGTVNQVMGDGIMALFGAPVAHEDHAVRASYAALRMQQSVQRYAEDIRRTEGIPVQIRVGLNSGEVVVRSIGSDLQMDYTAVGQTTHLAARMEQMATPGSILITPETLTLVEGYVVVKALGPMRVKGLEAPRELYEVVGASPIRSRLHASAVHGLTRFVGRDGEREQLRQALEMARDGRGQVVAVVGEPGVGKSRLYWEFTRSHRAAGWLVIESGSVSYGKATAFLPIIDLLRAYCQVQSGDDARTIRAKVTGKVLSLDRALEPSLPAFLSLLDVASDDPEWDRLDPSQRRQRTLDGVKRLLLRESQVQPVLVVFEDLHWIDAETQALLDSLVESLPTARLLLLVNYRPEYRHGWSGKTYYRQLRVDPLPPETAGQLLEALLGTDAGLQPIKDLLIERTEGNPFFLEESVRTLVETGVLSGRRGSHRLAKAAASFQIPATAQAILAARIDRLSGEDKRLLQAASVIGKNVPFGLLRSVADLPEDELRRGLARLQAGEFLYEARLFPDIEYTFKHALTHAVAYDSLLQDRRRTLHRRITEAIERRYPDRVSEHVDDLADHAFRGELWAKAAGYCRQAGAKAMARAANREAATRIEQAMRAVAHAGDDADSLALAIDLRIEMRHALWPLGETARILDHLASAERLAETLADQRRLGQVLTAKGYSMFMQGAHERVVASSTRALAIAGGLGDFALEAAAHFGLGLAYHGVGDYRRAIERLDRNRAALRGERMYGRFTTAGLTSVLSLWVLARCHAALGAFAEAIASGQEAIRIAEAADHKLSAMWGDLSLGEVYLLRGDIARATPILERGLATCRDWDFPLWLPWLASRVGAAYVLAGRIGDGLPLLEQSVAQATSMGWGADAPALSARLGEARLAAGFLDDAREAAAQALALAVEHKARGDEAWALRLLGDIGASGEPADGDRAEAYYREGLAVATELEMRPLIAHCHAGLAAVFRRTGRRLEVERHVTAATALYREMDMGYWLARATSGG